VLSLPGHISIKLPQIKHFNLGHTYWEWLYARAEITTFSIDLRVMDLLLKKNDIAGTQA
jgi:hypothetical protein